MTNKVFSVSCEPLSHIYFIHSVPHLSLRYLYHLSVKHFQHLWLKNIFAFFRTTFGNFTVILTPSVYFALSSRFMCWDYLFMVSSDIFDQASLVEEGISLASSCLLCFAYQFVITDLYTRSLFSVYYEHFFHWNFSFICPFFPTILLYIYFNVIAA